MIRGTMLANNEKQPFQIVIIDKVHHKCELENTHNQGLDIGAVADWPGKRIFGVLSPKLLVSYKIRVSISRSFMIVYQSTELHTLSVSILRWAKIL